MGRLPRLRRFSGGRVRTGSLVALVVLFPAATLAMSGLNRDRQGGGSGRRPFIRRHVPERARGAAGDLQAGPPDLHRPGEPLVRSLLRDVPGRRRVRDGRRATDELRPRCGAGRGVVRVSHLDGRVQRWPPQPARGAHRHQRRGDERVHRRAPAHPAVVCGPSGVRVRRRSSARDGQPDVMSYLTRQEIPNYWAYADAFVLQDRMFAPTDGWTLPAHLFLVSGWSAYCYDPNDPMSCISDVDLKEEARAVRVRRGPDLRVDRHHLAARPRGRLVGVLRRSRDLFVPTVSRPGDRRCRRVDHGDEEPPARVHGPARDGSAGPHPRLRELRASRRSRDAPVGLVGRAGRRRERASAVEPRRRRRHGARHPAS